MRCVSPGMQMPLLLPSDLLAKSPRATLQLPAFEEGIRASRRDLV